MLLYQLLTLVLVRHLRGCTPAVDSVNTEIYAGL